MAKKAKTTTPAEEATVERTPVAHDPRVIAFRYINLRKKKDGSTFKKMGKLRAGGGWVKSKISIAAVEKHIADGDIDVFVNEIANGGELATYVAAKPRQEAPAHEVDIFA